MQEAERKLALSPDASLVALREAQAKLALYAAAFDEEAESHKKAREVMLLKLEEGKRREAEQKAKRAQVQAAMAELLKLLG